MVMPIKFNSRNDPNVATKPKNVAAGLPKGKMEDNQEDWRLNYLVS
jgi:hypothetical protein